MSPLVLAAALSAVTLPIETHASHAAAAAALAKSVDTGTLLFSRGDCLAIRVATHSPYTHVAAVVIEGGQPFVYDSMNGSGVRRLPLETYVTSHSPEVIEVVQPIRPFSEAKAERFQTALAAQVGRPYALVHHVTGRRSSGLHCSEYMTDALLECGVVSAQRPARVTPGSLEEGLVTAGLYSHTRTVRVEIPPAVAPTSGDWCDDLWIGTVRCSQTTWKNLCGWICCK